MSSSQPVTPLPIAGALLPPLERERIERDQLLAEAIAACDVDKILLAVKKYCERNPMPARTLHEPAPGLWTATAEGRQGRPLDPARCESWFHMQLYNAGNACQRAGELLLALEVYKQALVGHQHPSIYNNIASVLRKLGRYSESRTWLERAIALDPEYLMGYLRLAGLIATHLPGEGEPAPYVAEFWKRGGTEAMVGDYLRGAPDGTHAAIEPYL